MPHSIAPVDDRAAEAQALLALAASCEAEANPEMQAKWIESAWELSASADPSFRRSASSSDDHFDTAAGRFGAAMDARAYESAALMLVPHGTRWILDSDGCHCRITAANKRWPFDGFTGLACFPALALTAASLRARAAQREA